VIKRRISYPVSVRITEQILQIGKSRPDKRNEVNHNL
jgi:hypothetical protein